MKRDERTYDTVPEASLKLLRGKKVTIVGSGGLGGYVIEMLARIGIGTLRIVDGDVFDVTNLNRQLISNEQNLGKSKVKEAAIRVQAINSNVQVIPIKERLTVDNVKRLFDDTDVVMDCVDNVPTRKVMVDGCRAMKVPMIHGAVGAWNGQVMTVMPDDHTLEKIYGESFNPLPPLGAASFIPATVASYQVSECIKLLTNQGELLTGKMLFIDLLTNEHIVVPLAKED